MRRFFRKVADMGGTLTGVFANAAETITGNWTFSGSVTLSNAPSITSPTITGLAPATPVAGRLYRDAQIVAWVNFDGGTNAISDDVNVSSITDNGTGDYSPNFATNITAVGYCCLALPSTAMCMRINSLSVSSCRVQFFNEAGTATDSAADTCIACIGEL